MIKLFSIALSGITLLLMTVTASAQCVLSPTSPSVTVCAPTKGSTVTSPVTVVAGTTDHAHPVVAMKVYLDYVADYTVDASQLSAPLTMAAGSHNITVNAWDSSGAVFKTALTINVAASAPVSVAINPTSATLVTGQTQPFTATVLNTSNTAVTWSVDGVVNGNATVGMVSTSGSYTAGTATGNHNVVATSVADSTKSATAVVTVTAPAAVSVTIAPLSPTLATGQTQQFTATVLNTSNTAVTWSVDGVVNGNTTVGTVSTSGFYTAGTATGTHNVVATSVADSTKSATAVVTVSVPVACSPASAPPSLTVCNPASGETVANPVLFQAAAASNTAVSKFLVYVDSTLAYQALNTASINTSLTLSAGTHALTLQFYDGAWVKKTENITVTTAPLPVSVSISPTAATVAEGGTQIFTAAVQNTANTAVTWTVDGNPNGNTAVGTITGSGTAVTYTAPAATGTHTVTATSVADATKAASAAVTVSSTTAPNFTTSNHVFVVMEENQSFSEVFPAGNATDCSSSGMPYLCSLAAANGMALDFYSNVHGSLLDYLYATSAADWTGSPYDCTGSGCASNGVITGDNIVRALTAAGKTWHGYFEDMPSPAYMGGDTANYVVHHNPFVWYSDVANSGGQQSNMVPFTQLAQDVNANDLKNFNYIVPNILHDADGTGGQSAGALLSSADNWLNTNLSPLLSSAPFQPDGDGVLIVVFDEAAVAGKSGDSSSDNSCSPSQSSGCGGHIALVMVGPNVLAGSTASATYHFPDLVHTIIHLLGISDYMNSSNGAADIALFP